MKAVMQWLNVILGSLLFLANLLILYPTFFVFSLFRLVPIKPISNAARWLIDWIVRFWIRNNNRIIELLTSTKWTIETTDRVNLSTKGSYFMVSNHISGVDIPVLQKVFSDRTPFLKFFLKQELIWVPLLGYGWWALDFPFMKRYSKEYLAKHPEKRGQDFIATQKACEKFKHVPVTVINYLEGTRFTPEKHKKQNSPFKHLLKPKAGGLSYALSAMGPKIQTLIDVTIIYPQGKVGLFDLFANRIQEIVVIIDQLDIPSWLSEGDYQNDPEFRQKAQDWVNALWIAKDQRIEDRLNQSS